MSLTFWTAFGGALGEVWRAVWPDFFSPFQPIKKEAHCSLLGYYLRKVQRAGGKIQQGEISTIPRCSLHEKIKFSQMLLGTSQLPNFSEFFSILFLKILLRLLLDWYPAPLFLFAPVLSWGRGCWVMPWIRMLLYSGSPWMRSSHHDPLLLTHPEVMVHVVLGMGHK